MKASLESLSKIGAELYQAAQAAGAAGAADPAAEAAGADSAAEPKPAKKSEGKVVDADVEIVDDEKK
jgi:molecular chaperone DnaK